MDEETLEAMFGREDMADRNEVTIEAFAMPVGYVLSWHTGFSRIKLRVESCEGIMWGDRLDHIVYVREI